MNGNDRTSESDDYAITKKNDPKTTTTAVSTAAPAAALVAQHDGSATTTDSTALNGSSTESSVCPPHDPTGTLQQQRQKQQQQQHQQQQQQGSSSFHIIDNPMPHLLPEGENATPLEVMGTTLTRGGASDLVLIMVGLPATGKTHIAKRICRFLSFFHDIPSRIFNVGDYRRTLFGAQQPAEFYDPDNEAGLAARTQACDAALADLIEYMKEGQAPAGGESQSQQQHLGTPQPHARGREARVAAFDATNTAKDRRRHVVQALRKALNCKVMFVESICDQDELLENNIRKVKLATPDYRDKDPEWAVADFRRRRANYMKIYEPVEETEGCPFIKIINSHKFIVKDIRGYLPLKVVHFLMNLHTLPRTFFLTRHGQSHYNLLGKIGGDSGLTPNGIEYARRLAKFCKEKIAVMDPNSNDDNNNTRDRKSVV